MDLSKLSQQDRQEELRVKTLLELSTKRHNMQKELENLKVRLSVKTREVEKLKKEVISLQLDVPILERRAGIMKRLARSTLRQCFVENRRIERMQERVWDRINNFVSKVKKILGKNAVGFVDEYPELDLEVKLGRLQLQGEMETLHWYNKYQARKIKVLKLKKTTLEDDSFAI